MKKLIFTLLGLVSIASFAQNNDPVIMSVAGKDIKKSEFLQVYLKNNNDPKYDKASLDEYMELFKKLRLKVEEAKALGYDTIPRLVKELKGYRKQLSNPYMIDTVKSAELINEAYERMNQEVRASHILIRINELATPEDTLKAYNKILDLRKKALNGQDFGKLANKHSQDPSAKKNQGDLGYFSAFNMVYPFESAAYNTKKGDISMPVRTRFGYHIVKVEDKRKARGKILTAHIMILPDKDFKDGKKKHSDAETKIREIYAKLKAGESFKDLAIKYSEDQSSRPKGGMLPYFGTGTKTRMVPVFEDAAFALKNDEDYSEPFESPYGWHIVQRKNLQPIGSLKELKREIQSKVNKDSRALTTQKSFIEKLKKEYNFKSEKDKNWKLVLDNVDSSFYRGKYEAKQGINNTLFSFANKKYTVSDFLNHIAVGQRRIMHEDMNSLMNKKYDAYQAKMIKDYEDSQLERKYPKFKALMQEFNDGVLFYEVMNDYVWKKANKDTTGLKEFYNANKNDFMWNDRVDAVVVECDNDKIAKQARKMMKKKIPLDSIQKTLNATSKLNVKITKKKFEKKENKLFTDFKLKKGVNKPVDFNQKKVVVQVNEFLPAQPKKIKEAKGEISLAYQAYLEKKWLEDLSKKYPVTVNEEVLYSLGK